MTPLITIHLPMEEKALNSILAEASWNWRMAEVIRSENAIIYQLHDPDPEATSLQEIEIAETLDQLNKLLLKRRIQQFVEDPDHPGHIIVETTNWSGEEFKFRLSPILLTNGKMSIGVMPLP